jgi:hypothetical protein
MDCASQSALAAPRQRYNTILFRVIVSGQAYADDIIRVVFIHSTSPTAIPRKKTLIQKKKTRDGGNDNGDFSKTAIQREETAALTAALLLLPPPPLRVGSVDGSIMEMDKIR